ncbi:glucuronate isomerase [Pelagovum pacificum]|uniref:Uronate isomerase n=1 Tax=Pelagovum pacificum TaxID=2588711 RepID=A0A5C5GH85_9RHOB|nr:glucuronate isomerase [Pelagovum pacificum]QQA42711.1 glucuronate isomerase [Pelagovum pacificum]TNY34138.1 glucuronate isomerase [Pelagovum pacificum]
MTLLHPDRLFPAEPGTRAIARELYEAVKDAPIISPHGHCEPKWFAENAPFPDPARLFVVPDHYIFRMLVSQGVPMTDLGVPRVDGGETSQDARRIWRLFAEHYHLFRGTPTRMWVDHAFETVFGVTERLTADNADRIYDQIAERLTDDDYRPRALFDRFNIQLLATTDGALDDLTHHKTIRESGWGGNVVPTYRPDAVMDPEYEGFAENVEQLGRLTGEDTATWDGYLAAHRKRRAYFQEFGATATDHGHLTARTENLPPDQCGVLFEKCVSGRATADEADAFRAQMLTEMARMSVEDGMTLQIHAGSVRNHSADVMAKHGRDKGFDIPQRTDYVHALRPLLDAVGMEPNLTVIPFTLDETVYSRELAPLAGVYPALTLGPPWWFYDSFEGMMRFREQTGETAGIYNTAGFNDDTRAFCSIPARHDVARRADCHWLSTLVADHRIGKDEAHEMAAALTNGLVKKAYNL